MKIVNSYRIVGHEEICRGHFRLVLAAPSLAKKAKPGQFVQVQVADSCEPLLRRPLSIHRVDARSGRVTLFYRVVGRGTACLAGRQRGETVSGVGPLGKGFAIDRHCRTALLVAGGMGMAPLLFLADTLLEKKIPVRLLFGQVKRDRCLEKKLLAPYRANPRCRIQLASEQKEKGCFPGRVTGLAVRLLDTGKVPLKGLRIFACGPWAMYRSLQSALSVRGLECQVSLEGRMACGFGACLGCAVAKTGQDDYALVCKDGPVFSIHEINFNARDQIHGR